MAIVKDGAVWLTVDEAIRVVEVLTDPELLETLDGRHRQRLIATIEELQDQLSNTDGTSIHMDVAQIEKVLRLLRFTQDWFMDVLEWLGDVG